MRNLISHSNDNNTSISTPNQDAEIAIARQGLLDKMNFFQPTRSIIDWKMKKSNPSVSSMISLEEIRDYLKMANTATKPIDRLVRLDQCGFNFENGIARLIPVIAGKNGKRLAQEPLFFDRHGWAQFCSHLLPNRGNGFIRQLVHLQPQESVGADTRVQMKAGFAKMAAATMMAFASCNPKMVQLRTVLKPIGINPITGQRELARFIRAVVSPSYAEFSNLRMVETFLNEIGNHNCYRYNLSDSGMYLRLMDTETVGTQIELRKEYPTFNLWNSETGQRQGGMGSGFFQLVCLNGMTNHRTTASFQCKHIGDTERFNSMIIDGMASVRTANSSLIQEFNEARSIVIDDAFGWINNVLAGINGVTQKTADAVQKAMRDETSGEVGTLANVVNGMTLLAHNPDFGFGGDLWDQVDLEKTASKVLARGIRQSRDKRLFAPKIEA